MGKEASDHKFRRARSRILYQMTAILMVLLLASGIAIFFLVRGSQERLINRSIDKVVQVDAESISGVYDFLIDMYTPEIMEYAVDFNVDEQQAAIKEKRFTEFQKYVNGVFKGMVAGGLLCLDKFMLIATEPPITDKPMLFACSDEGLVYNLEVPKYLIDAIEEEKPYIWMENGIPELGRKDEQLIVIKSIRESMKPHLEHLTGFVAVGIKPMHEQMASINDFYDKEKRNTNIFLLIAVVSSIVGAILITFILFSYLIRKKITGPIDELSAVAEEVLEGNLDVEIEVRKGEEFEGLKRAFKAMVESFRKILARSVGEE